MNSNVRKGPTWWIWVGSINNFKNKNTWEKSILEKGLRGSQGKRLFCLAFGCGSLCLHAAFEVSGCSVPLHDRAPKIYLMTRNVIPDTWQRSIWEWACPGRKTFPLTGGQHTSPTWQTDNSQTGACPIVTLLSVHQFRHSLMEVHTMMPIWTQFISAFTGTVREQELTLPEGGT